MKRWTGFLLALVYSATLAVFAQDDHGHNRGNGGGWGNSGSGPQNNKPNRPKARPRPQKNPGPQGKRNTNHGRNNASNAMGSHHFNNPGGNAGSANRNRNAGQGFNHPANGNTAHAGLQQSNRFNSPAPVSPRLKAMGVSHLPQPITQRNQILNTPPSHSTFNQPHLGPGGAALHASVIAPKGQSNVVIQNHMTSIAHNTTFMNQVNVYNTNETISNHYYWHSYGGVNYCHYYDNWGYHWYGWYWGGTCFWSRWYANNWWWYDTAYARWCYWHDGFWWWQNPAQVNVVYVYNNGNYVAANTNTDVADQPAELTYNSKDGTRMVKIVNGDAFLYDTVEGESDAKPFFLVSNVKAIKFSNTFGGKPLRILVTLNDGSFQMFDADGNPFSDNGAGN